MEHEARQNPSALEAWASTVMSGDDGTDADKVGDVERAPGQAQYDPADVISVFMGARESAKQRNAQAPRPARRTAPRPASRSASRSASDPASDPAAAGQDEPQPS